MVIRTGVPKILEFLKFYIFYYHKKLIYNIFNILFLVSNNPSSIKKNFFSNYTLKI